MGKLRKQISLGTNPYTGKRVRAWVSADSKAGLKQAEKDAIMRYAKYGRESSITVKSYIDQYFAAYCSHLAINTQEGYKTVFRKCAPIYQKKMGKVTRTDLQALVNDNWDHPWICKKLVEKLNAVWDMAASEGIVEKNIARNLSVPKAISKEQRPLTQEEKDAIKTADFTPMEKLFVDIEYQFGLRPGETLCLCKSDINYKDKTMTISKSLTHKNSKPVIKKTKTEKIRTLPVPDSFLNRFKTIKTFYFFMTEDGTLFGKKDVDKFKDGILEKINLAMGGTDKLKVTDMTIYTIRHNRATDLYYLSVPGLSNKAKADYMGHSEEMFLKRYSHMVPDKENVEVLRREVI